MLWKGMTGRGWTEMLQQWGIAKLQAVELQRSVAVVMRDAGPALGDLHWRETVGLGKESVVIPEEAVDMLEAARQARRLREPGWCGERGQGKWKAHRLLSWAARELAASRREVEMQLGDEQDWEEREKVERQMGDSLLKWLGFDKPPKQRVRHKVWKKQLTATTRQLKLGADTP